MEKSIYDLVNESADLVIERADRKKRIETIKRNDKKSALSIICIVEFLIIGYLITH